MKMDGDDMPTREALKKALVSSRNNLAMVVGLTLVNLVLLIAGSTLSFPFSAALPLFIIQIGQLLSAESGSVLFLLVALGVSLLIIGVYFLCFMLAKKHPEFIMIAMIVFCLDTLFLLWTLALSFEVNVLIDMAFHAWILFYLITGTRAWLALRKLPPEEEGVVEIEGYVMAREPEQELPPADSAPLRAQSEEGRPLLTQIFGDLQIAVIRYSGITELAVNGMVYAEEKGLIDGDYTLQATVDNVQITLTQDLECNMRLYVNGNLLAIREEDQTASPPVE